MKFSFFLFSFFSCLLFSNTVSGQELLFSENFNDCSLPTSWNLSVTNGQDDGVIFGYPLNTNSDSIAIDGSCMVMFDDDILGDNMPDFKATLTSPQFSTNNYPTIRLTADVHFRAYETSTFTITVIEENGNRIEIREFGDDDQTGTQFSEIVPLSIDLGFYTSSENISLEFEYSDGEIWAWWAGLDNVAVIGSGAGNTIITEQFNICTIPAGWSTNIITGAADWRFGEIINDNAQVSTMDGSCFAYFDDDGIGQDAPFSTVDLITPVIDGTAYANFQLDFDFIFRRYADFENVSVLVYDGISETQIVREFPEDIGGPQFNVYQSISIDLTPYRSASMQVIFRYEDGNEWGWWTGIDNVKITGEGSINDLCENAFDLNIGASCTAASNRNAIFSGPVGSCNDSQIGSLWYLIEPQNTGTIAIENISEYNDQITIYSGNCNDPQELICSNRDEHGFDGETIYLEVTSGASYWIRLSGVVATYGKSRGESCIAANYINVIPVATLEDVRAQAVALNFDEPCTASNNIAANIEGISPELNELTRSDIWFVFNSIDITAATIDTESEFAEIITLYDADLNEVKTQLYGGEMTIDELTPNAVYYLQVAGIFAKLEGQVCVAIKSINEEDPISDNCFDAFDLTLNTTTTFDNSFQTFSGIYPDCDIYMDQDIWYEFNTASENNIYLDIESDFVNGVAVYHGSCNDLEQVWCGKNLEPCQGSQLISGLEPNSQYFLQVFSSYTNNPLQSGMAALGLSETPRDYAPVNLTVTPICDNQGTAQLSIIVNTQNDYTLLGTSAQELLFEGDEYLVIARDSEGCETSVKGTVACQSDNCSLQIIADVITPNCFGESNGSIALEANGGLAPFEFEWQNTSSNVAAQGDLPEGLYQVKITDALGCFIYETIELIAPEVLTSELTTIDQQTLGVDDGSASVLVEGGTGPYEYLWSNGETTQAITDLAPGNYNVLITDDKGCTRAHTFTIKSLDCIFTIDAQLDPISCFEGNDGSITVTSSDGNILDVNWDSGESGNTLMNLSAGTYVATITLAGGCEEINEYTLLDPESITIDADITDLLCNGDASGSINLTISGGTGAGTYSYLWENGNTDDQRINLFAGEYLVTVTDSNGCSAESTLEVEEPEAFNFASTVVENVSCSGLMDGAICAFVEGGSPPYQFQWPGIPGANTAKVTDLNAGIYEVIVSDNVNCSVSYSISVNEPTLIAAELLDLSITTANDGHIQLDITGGNGGYTVEWFENGTAVGTGTEISSLSEGVYYAVITDDKGCSLTTPDYLLTLTATYEVAHSDFNIYPNPATESFLLTDTNNLSTSDFDVFSADGKMVTASFVIEKMDANSLRFWFDDLASGVYMISQKGEERGVPVMLIGAEK